MCKHNWHLDTYHGCFNKYDKTCTYIIYTAARFICDKCGFVKYVKLKESKEK